MWQGRLSSLNHFCRNDVIDPLYINLGSCKPLTPTIRLLSYRATGFGGDYVFYATLKVTPCKPFDSVHALLCTRRHDRSNLIYRHLPDQAQSGASALSTHPSQREGRDRLSFSSNRWSENCPGGHPAMLLSTEQSCKKPDNFSREFYYRANLESNGPASATAFWRPSYLSSTRSASRWAHL